MLSRSQARRLTSRQHLSVIIKYSWIHLPRRSILNHLACTRCRPGVYFLAEVFTKDSRFLHVYWIYATPSNPIHITRTTEIKGLKLYIDDGFIVTEAKSICSINICMFYIKNSGFR